MKRKKKDERKKTPIQMDGVFRFNYLTIELTTTQLTYAYIPQSSAEGSSIIEKSHISMPISILTGMFIPSTALAFVISIMAGP